MGPDTYNSAFVSRWCRKSPLIWIFSERNRAEIWRQLWIWLAEAERGLGLNELISEEMINELEAQKKNIDWEKVCPKAAGIIHLGATSCFVQDNSDLIIQRQALQHILERSAICLDRLADFALKHASLVTVGRTHFQHASLTTVGKRASLWADGLLDAFKMISRVRSELRFRGVKGAVGTQDTLMQLFKGDSAKVVSLDATVAAKAGFQKVFGICGQTYPRYQDSHLIFSLSLLASAAEKLALDIRLLQAEREMAEPFEKGQVGSSAMPYKQNPIRCERICGIAQYMISMVQNPLNTFAHQGFERTLDDSASRRLFIPDSFFATDAILSNLQFVLEGLQVHEEVISQNVRRSSAFLERALMLLVEEGGNRQEAHERIRRVAIGMARDNEPEAITAEFPEIREKLMEFIKNPLLLCGRAEEQTEEFVKGNLRPAIADVLSKVENAGKRYQLDV